MIKEPFLINIKKKSKNWASFEKILEKFSE
jgi:hypothetical protein